MLRLLAIDPGKTGAWALFKHKELVVAAKGDPRKEVGMSLPSIVVIEAPRWYPREREIDTNDLLDLSLLVGEYKGHYEAAFATEAELVYPRTFAIEVELVYPRTWKGTLPWEICCRRVLAALMTDEVAVLPKKRGAKREPDDPDYFKNFSHDVLDAVGIGLWKLRRFR